MITPLLARDRRSLHSVGRTCLLLSLSVLLTPAFVSTASAGTCQEEFPSQPPRTLLSSRLPDCRAYEQVTPTDKNGNDIQGLLDRVQASSSGEAVSFFAASGLPVPGSGAGDFPTYVASRGPAGWMTHGVLPPTQPAAIPTLLGFTPDLSQALLEARLPGDSQYNLYLRDNASGAAQRLVAGGYDFALVAFSADRSHLFFESDAPLGVPSAAPGVDNLYDLNHGTLSLAGVLPDGSTPAGGSFAGPYYWPLGDTSRGGALLGLYTQTAVSTDGSRVFFTAGGTAQLYVRENDATTVQVSASQRTVPDPNGPKPAAFMAATPDGSKVFFTSCEKLTNDSTAVSTASSSCTETSGASNLQGQDLYAYDVSSGALTDLTVDNNAGDALGAAVQGVLGSSADGSYVYFVANGVLAPGASPGSCQGVSPRNAAACNLYLWHDGAVSFIARLQHANTGIDPDVYDWTPYESAVQSGHSLQKESRVSADGRILLFGSTTRLTGYDNHGFTEFYRYDAAAGRLDCVSCVPTGAPPIGDATMQDILPFLVSPDFRGKVLTRNLSADGSRVFFETPDALVPRDTNGDGGCPNVNTNFAGSCQDVYEWEANGAGSCHSSADDGGCLYLISTGTSADPSYFADASANGDNVLFFTRQALVGQDQDQLVDIYDARVGGGIAAQNPPSPTPPCSGEECHGPSGSPPVFGVSSSATFSGIGNLTPPASTPVTPKTPAQLKAEKLARALKACKKKPKKRRPGCERQARRAYGSAQKAKKSRKGGK
jgi:hypothetical protein